MGAVLENRGDAAVGFDIVDQRRLAPQPALGRVGGARGGLAAQAHDRGHQRSLLATDKGTGPDAHIDPEVEIAFEHAAAEQAAPFGGPDSALEPFGRDRVFAAHVEEALVGADRIAGDGHAFEHPVGV